MEIWGKKWDNERAREKLSGRKLRNFGLFDTKIDDDFLREIALAGSLQSLHVTSNLIADDSIVAIVNSCPLKSLLLSGVPKLTDAAMEAICSCSTLRELYLEGTAVTDDSMNLIGRLQNLWSLNLRSTGITDEGIRKIASKTINLIMIRDTAIHGMGLSSWSTAEKVNLYADGSALNDEGLATVCRAFPFLWNVTISNTNVTDEGIRNLSGQRLPSLRIDRTKIASSGVEWLVNNLPDLESLEIDPTQTSEGQIAEFRQKNRRLRVSIHTGE